MLIIFGVEKKLQKELPKYLKIRQFDILKTN